MRATVVPELIQIKAPEGPQEAVREAANREGQTASEFIRQAIRAQLRRGAGEQTEQPKAS